MNLVDSGKKIFNEVSTSQIISQIDAVFLTFLIRLTERIGSDYMHQKNSTQSSNAKIAKWKHEEKQNNGRKKKSKERIYHLKIVHKWTIY